MKGDIAKYHEANSRKKVPQRLPFAVPVLLYREIWLGKHTSNYACPARESQQVRSIISKMSIYLLT